MRVYFPTHFEDVTASQPHPPNTVYRVSRGFERWDDQTSAPVAKIQMVYDGVVSGRRSPSYPLGTDDFARVSAALERVLKGGGDSARGMISPV